MKHKRQENGFSITLVFVVVVAVLAIGFGVWRMVASNNDNTANNSDNTQQTNDISQQEENSHEDDSDYLIIQEWNVKVALPEQLRGSVTYMLGDTVTDPDGNNLQAARIFVAKTALTDTVCATTNTALGTSIDTAAQYIRSEANKPFNASRYKGTLKEGVLSDGNYVYHANYVTPDCVGGGENAAKIEELQQVLTELTKES